MLLFIHSNGQIDLTHLNVTFTETNQLFTDQFFNEISFPFSIDITDPFFKSLGFDTHYNAKINNTIFAGQLYRDGDMIEASLTIQQSKGNFAEAVIKAGLSDFPNFSKKLPELPLMNFPVEDILAHALTVIPKNYPDVNYNFPMVFTDKYKEDETFSGFEGIINNIKDGAYLVSGFVPGTNEDIIRNIVQPMPYLLYVLKVAIESAGYTLAGDVLTDPEMNRGLFYMDGEYYNKAVFEAIPFVIKTNEWVSYHSTLNGIPHYNFLKEYTITKKGFYEIIGDYVGAKFVASEDADFASTAFSVLISKVSGGVTTNHYLQAFGGIDAPASIVHLFSLSFDFGMEFEVGDTFRVYILQPRIDIFAPVFDEFANTIDLKIIPVRYLEPDGTPINSVLNLNKIDLPMTVPDITVSDFVTIIKNSKNYDFNVNGSVVTMNKITPQIDRTTAINFESSEIDEPVRTYHEDRSFVMNFVDGEANKEYKYDSAFIDRNGVVVNEYAAPETANTINVDALPLPVILRNGITTAFALDDEKAKARFVFYRGIVPGGNPVTFYNPDYQIPALLQSNFLDWLNFRISSGGWEWESIVSVEKFRDIKIQSLVYAYNNYHLFTEIEKERIDHLWWRITAKSENLI